MWWRNIYCNENLTNSLQQLPNLNSYVLILEKCFPYMHKIMKFNSVKIINIYTYNNICNECINFISKSFPNVNDLSVWEQSNCSYLQLVQLMAKSNKIERLVYACKTSIKIKEILFSSLNYLRLRGKFDLEGMNICWNIYSLSINAQYFSESELEILFENFPNVRTVELININLSEDILRKMGTCWKSLRKFVICDNTDPDSLDPLKISESVVFDHIQSLKEIHCNLMYGDSIKQYRRLRTK